MNDHGENKKAYLAGGCFWCIEADLAKAAGVVGVVSGYAGGHKAHPTYMEVCSETTGHRETVEVTYDPAQTTFRDVLIYFFEHIDPTDAGGQFHDRGESYTTAVFYHDNEEKEIAQNNIARLDESHAFGAPIATVVMPFVNFYPAEEYHQNYHEKNAGHYGRYRAASGRDELETANKGKAARVCAIKDDKVVHDLKSVLAELPIVSAAEEAEEARRQEEEMNKGEITI
jgi:peptide methionine sulfoxide reductase msrA/msrB